MGVRSYLFPTWQTANQRILTISTDEVFSSSRYHQTAPATEEFILNIKSNDYSLPEFVETMTQLKVLIITSFTDYPSKLHNLKLIEGLSNIREIKLDHVSFSSIQPIFELRDLKQLSFVMCEIGDALTSYNTQSPHMPSHLADLVIDTCNDLKELPPGLCNLVHLQKLTITNCHELDALPKQLGNLSNLEILILHCCTKLQKLPESIGSLHNLRFLDISDCVSISVLPEEIGQLSGLKVLKMNGCTGLQELPMSMSKLGQLEEVICDEETSYLWKELQSDLHNLKITVVEDDILESFMKIVQ